MPTVRFNLLLLVTIFIGGLGISLLYRNVENQVCLLDRLDRDIEARGHVNELHHRSHIPDHQRLADCRCEYSNWTGGFNCTTHTVLRYLVIPPLTATVTPSNVLEWELYIASFFFVCVGKLDLHPCLGLFWNKGLSNSGRLEDSSDSTSNTSPLE